jgi:hypothetical protein
MSDATKTPTHMMLNLFTNMSMPSPTYTLVVLVGNHAMASILLFLMMISFALNAIEKELGIVSQNGIIWTMVTNPLYYQYLLKLKKCS